MNLRKYPRTLNEAFGPYTSKEFYEPRQYSGAWWAAMIVIALVTVLLIWGTK